MKKVGLILLCGLLLAAPVLGREGKGTHALVGVGIVRAIGDAGTRQSLGPSTFAGLMFRLKSNLDLTAKIEYLNAPINRGYWTGSVRYAAIMVGPQLMYAPHDRDSHFASVLLVGFGGAAANARGYSTDLRGYGEVGVGLKLVYRDAPSPMLLIRLINLQFNDPPYTFPAVSLALKF